MQEQLTLWGEVMPYYKLKQPVVLIEAFAGIGSQRKALEILGVKIDDEKSQIIEWAFNSYIGYNAIHIKDNTDYSKNLSVDELVEKVKGTSIDYNQPLTTEQLKKKGVEWLKRAYNNIVATHNLIDISNVKGEQLLFKDNQSQSVILTYSFPCVIAGTKVKTENGYKNIEDITIEDKVLTHNGKYQKVLKTMNRVSNHYYIIKGIGCNLYLTEEHPLYVLRDGKIQWVKVKDLKKTDKLSYNINTKSIKCNYSNQLLWLLGRYVADGYISNYNSVCFAIGNKKAKVFEENTPNIKWKTFKKKGNVEYRIADFGIKQMCLEFSQGATQKKIPQWIIDLPREQLNAFFNGYMSGDGYIRERANTTQLMCSTVSKDLYLGLQDIMMKLFNAIPSLYIRKDKRKETFNDSYNLQLSLHNRNIWQERIENHLFVKISSIERIDNEIPVYNIEVENDNSYTCDNVIVHNCQDLSLAGHRKGMTKGTQTRSGLLWEVERILIEREQQGLPLPNLLIMENVPDVIGSRNIADFKNWELRLSQFGYTNYCEILNGKDYGIPQNRKRAFMISVLGEYAYDFPCKLKLNHCLEDLLQPESEVDKSFYLDEETINRIRNWKSQENPLENLIDMRERERVVGTLTARGAGEEHAGMKLVGFPKNEKVIKDTHTHEIKIKNNTQQGYLVAKKGDGIDISGRMETHRGTVQQGTSQTLTCVGGNDVGVVVNKKNE